MIREGKAVLATAVAMILLGSPVQNASAHSRGTAARTPQVTAGISMQDIGALRDASRGALLAVGRVDGVSSESAQVVVLGQAYRLDAAASLNWLQQPISVGTHIALFGERTEDGNFADATLALPATYVPGASPVFLSGFVSNLTPSLGLVEIAGQPISLVGASSETSREWIHVGDYLEVVGTQPLPGSVVLAGSYKVADASVGTGRSGASVGTGRGNASVGTGKKTTDASVGTGRSSASVGTGRGNASVGTGKKTTDASVGTGRSGASVGTGRGNASVGTG